MFDDDSSLEQAFGLMGRELHAVEPAEVRESRRKRVVGRLRKQHVRLLGERNRGRVLRQRLTILLVAVLALSTGVAIARVEASSFSRIGTQLELRKPALVVPIPAPSARPRHDLSVVVPETEPAAPLVTATKPSLRQHATVVESTVAEQELAVVNQLFAEAKRARREHDDERALALCEQLLAKYPRSVLAHEATVERLRALKRLGRREEAARRASEYLSLYPGGFAANEARQMVGPPLDQ